MSTPKMQLACFNAHNYTHAMIHGYAYQRDTEPLREAGAAQLWVDLTPGRYERAEMMRDGSLRQGDTLLIYSMHNLAGSPQAYGRWEADMKARGVTIKIAETEPRKIGRPRKYAPDEAGARRHWAIWTDGTRTERDRLSAIAADYGSPVTRQTLNGRYGNPSNPKQKPD